MRVQQSDREQFGLQAKRLNLLSQDEASFYMTTRAAIDTGCSSTQFPDKPVVTNLKKRTTTITTA